MTDAKFTRDIVDACHAMGFATAGVAQAKPTEFRDELLAWLAAGKHGEMTYLTELLDERLAIGFMLQGAKSVIIVADQYATGQDDPASAGVEPQGLIARYARG